MKFLNTTKYRLSMLVVMVMLLQILIPVVKDVVWAEGVVEPEAVEEQEFLQTTEVKEEEETGQPLEDILDVDEGKVGTEPENSIDETIDEETDQVPEETEKVEEEQNFTIDNIILDEKTGKAEIYWTFVSGTGNEKELEYTYQSDFMLDEGVTGGLLIGSYTISQDGFIAVTILAGQKENAEGSFIIEGIQLPEAKNATVMSGEENGKDLGNIEDFQYEINLYLGSEEEPVDNGDIIEIDHVKLLTYEVKFTIEDGFEFNNGDYLNLDISSLINLKGISLGENEISGRINFKFNDSTEIDAAGYIVEDNTLKITFDNNIDSLNNKKGRDGFVELGFNVEKTSEEVEVIEKVELAGTETKTFYILRKYDDASSITKNGAYDSETDKITWTIDVNKDLNDLENAILTDNIPTGLTVEKIELYDLKITVKDVETKISETYNKDIGLESEDVSINENNLQIVLGDFNREAKRIKIITSIDDGQSGELTFENIATLMSDSKDEISDSHSVSFNRVTGISKSGKWSGSGNKITWTIEFRTDSDEGTSELLDTPTLPEGIGLFLIEDSVKFNNNSDDSIEVELSEDGNTFIFKNIPNSKELQTLEFETEVIYKSNNSNNDGEISIGNTAEYNKEKADTSVEITRGEILSKDNGKVHGENGETYVDWNIKINKNNESWTNVEIWEYIPEGFEFVSAKIGNKEISGITDGTDGDRSYKKIPIGDIKQQTTIIVRTKLLNLDGFDEGLVKNQAKIKWKPDVSGGIGIGTGDIIEYSQDVEGNFEKSNFTHNLTKENTGINYEEQTTSWKVEYYTYDTRIEGLLIVDELKDIIGDHKYDQTSLTLTLNGVEYALTEGNDQTVTKDDKTLNYDLNFDGNNQKFTLKINSGDINDYHNRVVLKYTTKFDLSKMEDVDEGNNKLKNAVKVTNDGQTLDKDSIRQIKQVISKNGSKSVSYQSVENRVFNWTVELNHKGKTISKENKITDTLIGKQKYIDGSIKIYTATLKSDGTLEKGELLEDNTYTIDIEKVKKDEEGNDLLDSYDSGMEIVFTKDLTTPIIIEYQTEAVGISEENYKNKINYNGKDYDDNIGYYEFNKYITKDLSNDRNGNVVKGDILKWKLTINTSLSEIHSFELKDIMSEGLIFIEDSLKISHGETDVTDEFIIGDLSEGENGFKINKDLLDKKYTIEYETLVTADKEAKNISNDVHISGAEFERKLENQSKYNVISRSSAGGSGYSDNEYEVKIIKADGSGNPIKSVVKFKLITETKIGNETHTLEEELYTDNNGELIINLEKNEYNTYYIKEIEAPEGYILLDEEIEIILDGDDKNIEIEIVNVQKTEITGKKEWVNGPEQKPTIQLQLYRNGEAYGEPVELKNGETEYTWEDLAATDSDGEPYVYTVDEVEVPENYGKSRTDDKLTIINTYKSPKTDVVGRKGWDGGPDIKPTIWLQLYRNGEVFRKPVILKDGELEYTWKDLDRTDEKGVKYIYTVKEVDKEGNDFVPENYTKVEKDLTVTNTYVSPKTEVTGTKIWKGGPEQKPTIQLQLYRNSEAYGEPVELKDGETEYTWEDLDLTDENGVEYKYTIDEVKIPRNYRKSISEDNLTITNKYSPPSRPDRPDPYEPNDPEAPKDPEEPEDPEEPTDPTDSEEPEDPEDPTIGIDGDTPTGGTDVDKEDDPTIGLDGDTPKGGTDVDKPILPKTGENNNIFFYFIGLILITLGFVFRRKTV